MKHADMPVPYLLKDVRRINAIRWAMIGAGTIIVLIFGPQSQVMGVSALLLFVAVLLGGTFEVLYRSLQRNYAREPQKVGRRLRQYFYLQVCIEVILIAVGIHVTGGPFSPLSLVYLLYVGMLAVMFPTRQIILFAGFIIAIYAALMELYVQGWLAVQPPDIFLQVPVKPFVRVVEAALIGAIILDGIMVAGRARQLQQVWVEAASKNDFLDQMNQFTRQSLTVTDLPALCQILADQLGGVLGSDSAYIDAWDENSQATIFMAAHGPLHAIYPQMSLPPGAKTVTEAMRRLGGPLVIENLSASPHIDPEIAARFPEKSMLALPIYGYPDKLYWGAVLVAYHTLHKFSPDEVQRAQQLADLVALLISRARLYQETHSRAELLGEFSLQVTKLTSDLRHTTLLPGIVESARGLLKAQRAALFLRDAASEHLQCSHAIGLSEEYIQGIHARTRPALEEAALQENLVLVPDVTRDQRSRPAWAVISGEGFRAYGVFALTSPEGPRGVLAVYWDQVHAISAEEVAMARLFAERASEVLHNADLYAQVTEQSLTDELTGLPNRRALDKQMVQESARSFRFGRPFTLVMMDLDGFKSINDNFGHPMGDSVLQQVAAALRRSVRTTDFVARYGGDEFAVILPETDLSSAQTVVDKLRMALASCDLRLPNSTQRYISACMGLAIFPADTSVPDKLLEIADQRLYDAKHTRYGTVVSKN